MRTSQSDGGGYVLGSPFLAEAALPALHWRLLHDSRLDAILQRVTREPQACTEARHPRSDWTGSNNVR